MSRKRKGPTPRRRPVAAEAGRVGAAGEVRVPPAVVPAGVRLPAAAGRPAAATPAAAPAPRATVVEQAPAAGRLEVTAAGCAAVRDLEPAGLGVTYWYEAPAHGEPGDVTVRFTGRRTDGPPSDLPTEFSTTATVPAVLPGSGRSAVTARVTSTAPGTYEVRAAELAPTPTGPTAPATGRTSFSPVVRVAGPGVILGAWPALVLLGTVLALVLQNRLAAGSDGLPPGRVLALTAVSCFVGVAGAKIYYLLTHRTERSGVMTAGMSVQGFVLGAVSTLVAGGALLDMGLGDLLDVTAPGLLLGMTVGRFGCLLGGCCAGRPTASRWGVRSSDRRLLTRRIPVQLLEGAVAALAAGVALALLLTGRDEPGGAVFAGALAGYMLGRQLLFPLRDIPRATRYGRPLVLAASAAVVVVAGVALA